MAHLQSALRRHRLDVALVCLLLSIVGPFVPDLTAQGGARYALTAAIVEERTVQLDSYEPIVGIDRVERGGHLYSDKAPAQPVLGVPALVAAEALGASPGTEHRVEGNVGAWSQVLVCCGFAGALLLVLMRRHASRFHDDRTAAIAAAGLSFGTMLLPFSTTLYGHVLAALLSFGAWHLVSLERAGPTALIAGGTLGALAVATEYPLAWTLLVLGVWVLVRHGLTRALVFALPTALIVPLMILYNQLAYGQTSTGYTAKSSGGRLNYLQLPDPGHVIRILFGERGFIFTPIVLLALVGLVVGIRSRRWDLLVPLSVFGGYFLLQAGWPNPWGGEGPGPRYIAPALPFLVLPAALMLERIGTALRRSILGLGFVSMGLVVLTFELVPHGGVLIETHLRHLTGEHGLNPTVFTLLLGPAGWILHLSLIALAARALHRAWPRGSAEERRAPLPVLTG